MNRYGQMALDHWRTQRPLALTSLADPDRYFTGLGEQVETQVGDLRDQILGSQQPTEDLESYRLRSYQARRQAEEVVLADLVWTEPEAASDPEDETDEELVAHYERLRLVSELLSGLPATWTDTAVDETVLPY